MYTTICILMVCILNPLINMLIAAKSSQGSYTTEDILLVRLINAHSSQKQSDSFDEIFQPKAYLGKYMKEKCK